MREKPPLQMVSRPLILRGSQHSSNIPNLAFNQAPVAPKIEMLQTFCDQQIHPAQISQANGESVAKFNWSQVEAPDYQQYVKNLRAIGCPETTIADIITADVHSLYEQKRANLMGAVTSNFWSLNPASDPAAMTTRMKLEEEERSVLKELLGSYVSLAAFGDKDSGSSSLVLPPQLLSKKTALANWADSFGQQFDELLTSTQGREMNDSEMARFIALNEAKADALKRILTPEELEEFDLRNSPIADEIKSTLGGMELSEDEFRALFRLRQDEIEKMAALDGSDAEAIQGMKAVFAESVHHLLGDEKFANFQALQSSMSSDPQDQPPQPNGTDPSS